MIFSHTLLMHTLALAALVAANPLPNKANQKWILRQDDGFASPSASGTDMPSPTQTAPSSTGTVSVIPLKYNEHWSAWTTTVNLGSQPFEVQLDLQSSVLAVGSTRCKDVYSCLGRPLFEDFKNRDNVQNNSTICTTDRGLDMGGRQYQVKSASLGDWKLSDQSFLALDKLPGSTAFQAFAGVLGLNLPNTTADSANATIINLSEGLSKFALQLTAYENATSELSLGGVNRARIKGSPTYFSIDDSGMWQLANASLSLSGIKLDSSFKTRFSTTTRGIWGPAEVVNKMYVAIEGAERWPGDVEDAPASWVVPCDAFNKRPLMFSWAGGKGTDGSAAAANNGWIVKRPALWELDDGKCLGAVVGYPPTNPLADENIWTLGHMWMESAYHIFDSENKTVGIASFPDI